MLKLDNLCKVFFPGTPNEVRALRGVSLELEPGPLAALARYSVERKR